MQTRQVPNTGQSTDSDQLTAELMDAGRRAADAINAYRAHRNWDELQRKWLAVKMSDGTTDGTLYDTRKDAVKFQRDERFCFYFSFQNAYGGVSARDMALLILFNRKAYKAGMRLTDPEHMHGGRELIMTTARRDQMRNDYGL